MQHLLIIGAQRSGTSLLTWLLGSQDGVALSTEVRNRAWRRVVGHEVIGVKLLVPGQIQLRRQSHSRRAFKRIEKHLLRPVHNVVGAYVRTPALPGRMSIEDFLELESPFVIPILRDPHEVIASNHDRGEQPLWECRRQFRHAVETIHALWKSHPGRVHLVDFELLVRDPETVVRQCCESLQQPFDPARISGYTKNYGRDRIDSEKAPSRPLPERLEHPVFDGRAQLRAQYDELLEAAAATCGSPGSPHASDQPAPSGTAQSTDHSNAGSAVTEESPCADDN
jgi:hypothetical protein